MFYSTDCNYIVQVIGKEEYFECYTKEQVKRCIRHPNGTLVYKVNPYGKLELLVRIKPEA